jgi:hypothetical protein
MRVVAIIIFVLGLGLLVYSFFFIGNEHNAQVMPYHVDQEPARGQIQSLAGTVMMVVALVIFYFARKRENT